MKRLYRFAPHSRLSNNPLFNYEVRGIRWGYSESRLRRYSLRRLATVSGVLLLIWLLIAIRNPLPANDLIILFLALSLLVSLPLDYTFMSAALGSINGDVSANRWNLLRLTPLTGQEIVAAKHGTAQVRAWRWMILVVALRVAVALIAGVNFLFLIFRPGAWAYRMPGQAITSLIGQIIVFLLCLIYVIEPFWRMRTVTALGIAISARARQQTSSVLAAVGTVVALWVAQGFIALAVGILSSLLFVPLAFAEIGLLQVVICSPTLLVALVAGTIYGFYSVVQSWSLRRAERWIAHTD